MVDVVVTQTGYAGETVTLDVEDEGRIVGSQEVKLPIDGEPAAVRVRFTASDAGPARVPLPDRAARRRAGDAEQPARGAGRRLRSHREDPLLRGRAAPEMKFLHRAVDDDKNLQVVTLLRTADNKFYRLLLDTPNSSLAAASRRPATSCSPTAA